MNKENKIFEKSIDLLEENEKLKAELKLYRGSLHREHEAIHRANDLEDENTKLKEIINKLKKAIAECWYMDSKHVGEQVFLKKCELKSILEETDTNVGEVHQ